MAQYGQLNRQWIRWSADPTCAALIVVMLSGVLTPGCGKLEELRATYRAETPREAYEQTMRVSGLEDTAMGAAWLSAAEASLESPLNPGVPYRETGFFESVEPQAAAFEISLMRGQRLSARAAFAAPDSGGIFLDLFRDMASSGLGSRRVALSDSTQHLVFDATRSGRYLVRVQPELLVGGLYKLEITVGASIVFPVAGHDSRSIQSRFGDARDGGRRQHHGVDIFARRNTPVVAATAGVVSSTRTGGLGGRTVWVRSVTGANLYYAHLEKQLVRRGQRVAPGDTLGLVGNSGNARTTPPHLHFGIYQNGPVDPFPYVHAPDRTPRRITADVNRLGSWMRTSAEETVMRDGFGRASRRVAAAPSLTGVRVVAAAASSYRVVLPDGTSGYAAASDLEAEDEPIDHLVLASTRLLKNRPTDSSASSGIEERGNRVAVKSRFGEYVRVRTSGGTTGWLRGS